MRLSNRSVVLFAVLAMSAGSVFAASKMSFITPSGGEVFIPGETYKVSLSATSNTKAITLELSTDNGVTFNQLGLIDDTLIDRPRRTFFWKIPATQSTNAVLRASGLVGANSVTTLSSVFSIGTVTGGGGGALGPNSVTNPTIAPGAVDNTKISSTGISSGFVLNADGSGGTQWSPLNALIQAGSITTVMLAPGTTATNFSGPLLGDVTGTQAATVVSKVNLGTATLTGTVPVANLPIAGITAGTRGAIYADNTSITVAVDGKLSALAAGVTLGGEVTGPANANAVTNAVSANTANAIVRRDAAGNFAAGTVSADGFSLPVTSSPSVGVITQNGNRMLHTFGNSNFFAGVNAGNFTTTGGGNNASGNNALMSNTSGNSNVASGTSALGSNSSGSGNTASGNNSLFANSIGNNNTAFGIFALQNNTSGSSNIAVGINAGFNLTTGSNNIDIGNSGVAAEANIIRIGTSGTQTDTFLTGIVHGDQFSLPVTSSSSVGVITQNGNSLLHTFGGNNVFVGRSAGNFSMTGNSNAATGFQALNINTSGNNNAASGNLALASNTTGNNNTASGSNALFTNSTADNNSAIGTYALFTNSTGVGNTASGYAALQFNTTGGNNIALGASAGINLTTGSNNIDIGNGGVAAEANTIRIGSGGTQTATFIAGISGVPIAGGVPVTINGAGQLGFTASSRRYKDNIQPMAASSEKLLQLKPVTFTYKKELDPKSITQWGLIAEEVAAINPDWVVYDEKGAINTVRYEQINAMLLNEFLKEHQKVEALEARLEALEAKSRK